MKSKNIVMPTGIIGIIVIILSLAVFFLLNIEKNAVNNWALTFLLLSEVALFGGLIWLRFSSARYGKVFLNAGIGTTLILYFITTLISVLFTGMFREKPNTFVLIELVIIAVFAIISVSIITSSHRVERSGEEDMTKIGNNEPKRGGF